MSIHKLLFLPAVIFCCACSSDLFLEHNGNMPAKDKVALIHNGLTKQEVNEILGSPSLITGLNDNHWIYMSSTTKRVAFFAPQELDRQIMALTFDNDKISDIENLTLADANNIKIDTDETLTADKEEGFFRKYFGGVGAYMPFGSSKEKGI
jgi:outer membrane protein assembly factor BamE (lipoprotein component of BamABCDE complex)